MEHQPYPHNATKPPQTRVPWPLIALIIAAALLIVTLWLSPRSNKAATRALNTGTQASQIALSSVNLVPQPANGQANVDLYGMATNTGGQPVTNAIISATFRDQHGNPVLAQQQPMQRVDSQGKNGRRSSTELAQEPLEPGKTTGFRVSYTQVPEGWNHQPPDLSVLQVTVQK
jgi:lipopolysaccharide export LptBFGC system permease protein LptF